MRSDETSTPTGSTGDGIRLAGGLRAAALVAVVAGAIGSIVLLLRAGTRTPGLVLIMMVLWVAAPFAGLGWAHVAAARWPARHRITLAWLTLVLTVVSLAVYSELVPRPAGSARGFMFVALPPVSWLFLALLVLAATFASRRRP